MSVFSRPLSPLERACYLGYDSASRSPRMMQFILEGTPGERLHASQWQTAIKQVASECPASRLRLRGHLGWSRWEACAITPELQELEDVQWDARSVQDAVFLNRSLDVRRGPTCRVVLLQGDVPRALFQIHHAAMDGMGGIEWIRNLLRQQRGEAIVAINSGCHDIELAQRMKGCPRAPKPFNAIAPLGIASTADVGMPLFVRRSLATNDHQLIARIAAALATIAAPQLETVDAVGQVLRIAVPVDLRRHLPGTERSSANLTGVIDLEPTPGQSAREIQKSLIKGLREQQDLQFPERLPRARWWPVRWLTQSDRAIMQALALRRFYYSAYISPMGRHEPTEYNVPGFTCNNVYGVITPHPGVPLYISFGVLPRGIELMVGCHSCYCEAPAFECFVDRLCDLIC